MLAAGVDVELKRLTPRTEGFRVAKFSSRLLCSAMALACINLSRELKGDFCVRQSVTQIIVNLFMQYWRQSHQSDQLLQTG